MLNSLSSIEWRGHSKSAHCPKVRHFTHEKHARFTTEMRVFCVATDQENIMASHIENPIPSQQLRHWYGQMYEATMFGNVSYQVKAWYDNQFLKYSNCFLKITTTIRQLSPFRGNDVIKADPNVIPSHHNKISTTFQPDKLSGFWDTCIVTSMIRDIVLHRNMQDQQTGADHTKDSARF